jgi:hypothetical protein
VDYVSHRTFWSVFKAEARCVYEASTSRDKKRGIRYTVKALGDTPRVYEYHTPSGVWEKIVQDIKEVRKSAGLPTRKHTTVSGPAMYGWTHPRCTPILDKMRPA